MVQRREDLGFATESGEPFCVMCEAVWQDLQGNIAPKFCISRAVDLAHTAGAERGEDFVRAEPRFRT
jgi:hypothetical protein